MLLPVILKEDLNIPGSVMNMEALNILTIPRAIPKITVFSPVSPRADQGEFRCTPEVAFVGSAPLKPTRPMCPCFKRHRSAKPPCGSRSAHATAHSSRENSPQPGKRRELLLARRFRLRPLRRGKRSEEHTSELQSLRHLVCRLLLE